MSTAVHGKASIADMLLADSASAGKGADDARDKTNTVDFGATLTHLIDQAAAGKDSADSDPSTSAPASARGKQGSNAPTTFDWSAKNVSTALDSTAADATMISGPSALVTPTAV